VDKKKVKEVRKNLKDKAKISDIADIFKLLGEPTRLKIILALIKNELCVCDISATIDSTVSAVSHQLRLLRNARIVKYRKDGKMVYYSIDDGHINSAIKLIKDHSEEK
jgi:DNA-binding transcriptional ArsR family regulator